MENANVRFWATGMCVVRTEPFLWARYGWSLDPGGCPDAAVHRRNPIGMSGDGARWVPRTLSRYPSRLTDPKPRRRGALTSGVRAAPSAVRTGPGPGHGLRHPPTGGHPSPAGAPTYPRRNACTCFFSAVPSHRRRHLLQAVVQTVEAVDASRTTPARLRPDPSQLGCQHVRGEVGALQVTAIAVRRAGLTSKAVTHPSQ
jgi:hypothetical protein